MDIVCPKGHISTDPDYCSECGAKIVGAPSALPVVDSSSASSSPTAPVPPAPAGAGGDVCPDCGAQRASASATFCEVCRYNFVTRKSWSTPKIDSSPPPAPLDPPAPAPASTLVSAPTDALPSSIAPAPAVTPPPVVDLAASVAPSLVPDIPAPDAPADASSALVARWQAVVVVDPALYVDPDPDLKCPTDEPERTFPLDLPENLVGRRSDSRAIRPEVPLNDPGVSHRHAKLLCDPDGGLALLDVGSTNGTQLNGAAVSSGVRMPLKDGDQIVLGCWTRLTIRSV